MKALFLTLPLVLLFSRPEASLSEKPSNRLDNNIAKCHSTVQTFAALADDPAFGKIHLDPEEYVLQNAKGKMITYDVKDGEQANAYYVPAKKKSNEYLFVIHEWYGLNEFVKSQSDIFSDRFKNMNIIALDLYDGNVADNREDARKYMQSVTTERAMAIIAGAQAFAGEDADIFTVGWCFGGGWSLQSAIELGDQAKGAIMFYGMPENDLERLGTLKCDVLGIFATKDRWINQEVADKFETNMAKIPNQLTLKSYEADHGFANPSNPIYDEEAATDAYQQMADFIAARR
ncbi:MAG: dienelactone hydrolase family protein [Cyclobacteriaceae bacterium]